MLGACADDTIHLAPSCDEIGFPLGLEPLVAPPVTDYAVECAEGWGNDAEPRAELDTIALPGAAFLVRFAPEGGWLLTVHGGIPGFEDWERWFERWELSPSSGLIRLDADGETPLWVRTDIGVWSAAYVDGWVWALGRDGESAPWLWQLEPGTGVESVAHPWDDRDQFNWMFPARDADDGAWITAHVELDDGSFEQILYRATAVDQLVEVARRAQADPGQRPYGGVVVLPDGGAVWSPTGAGFEVLDADGGVRWTRAEGSAGAADADSMVISTRVPTGIGAGRALHLEKVALADGATIWERDYQRYEVVEPEQCGSDECAMLDAGYAHLRPDGGYIIHGSDAYPSSTCRGQPRVMAVSADGDAQWAHRVDACAWTGGLHIFADERIEISGTSSSADGSAPIGAWVRRFL